jgi:hypothetical protein
MMASSSCSARSRSLLSMAPRARHQEVGGVAAGSEPQRPDAVLDLLGAVVVGRSLQRTEQEIEVAGAVAALRMRQVARRLHRRDGVAMRRRRTGRPGALRRRGKRAREQKGHGRHDGQQESAAHGAECKAPQAGGKMAISAAGARKMRRKGGAGLRPAQPWRALKRRLVLLMI